MNPSPYIEELSLAMWRSQNRLKAAVSLARHENSDPHRRYVRRISRNAHLKSKAIYVERFEEAEIWICYTGGRADALKIRSDKALMKSLASELMDPDALCGYVAFPKRHAPRSVDDLYEYIPVHGGVTYQVKDQTAAVWGFDTLHHNSHQYPRTDQDWIRKQCIVLYKGLKHVADISHEWVKANRHRRIELAIGITQIVPGTRLGV
jgi:hypothetical protein